MSTAELEIIRLPGLVPYGEAMRVQGARRDAVEQGNGREAVFLLEHAPVITLGRRWRAENLLRPREAYDEVGIEVCETDRGGDVTYHGPGQFVAYPVLRLDGRPQRKSSIPWYLRALEEVLIGQLAGYGLEAGRRAGFTGVWVGGGKIAAIGVRIHNWTTSHGIALNVDPHMGHFGLIVPCGIADKPVTSLKALLGEKAPDMAAVMDDFERSFRRVF